MEKNKNKKKVKMEKMWMRKMGGREEDDGQYECKENGSVGGR